MISLEFLYHKKMTLNLTLLILGLLIASAMTARKWWLLRTGKIIAGSYEEADWTDLSVESIRSYFVGLIKISVHKSVLFSLKSWILFTHFIKRSDKLVKAKLLHLIHKNGRYEVDINQKPSEFLKNIKTHKDKMMEGIKKEE